MSKKVWIVGVPMDLGTSRLGVDMGPTAIRYAELARALAVNGVEHVDHGDLPVRRHNGDGGGHAEQRREIATVSEELAAATARAVRDGFIPVVLGGDHSTAIGSIAGVVQGGGRVGLIWVDNHPDANTPETSPSGNVHGMTVAISLGYGYPELVNCAGFAPKVRPEDICMIGVNDADDEELRFLEGLGVRIFSLMDVERLGIVRVAEEALATVTRHCDRVHLSFDIDALDPLIAPGTGILSRGGLSYREILYLMRAFGGSGRIGSMDVIEINPLMDIRNQTSELAVELILAALGGKYGDYQRHYLAGVNR